MDNPWLGKTTHRLEYMKQEKSISLEAIAAALSMNVAHHGMHLHPVQQRKEKRDV